MRYSSAYKAGIIKRMLPPNNESIQHLARTEGISEQTLRNWRKAARANGQAALGHGIASEGWSSEDKFLVVVETISMSEHDLAGYAREKGLYVEQIKAWRDACMSANGGLAQETARMKQELKATEQEKKKLLRELKRKEQALAEAAALLVLSKKAQAIWGEPEGA